MPDLKSRLAFVLKVRARRLAATAASFFSRHPWLQTTVRRIVRAVPGMKTIARKLLPPEPRPLPSASTVPLFEPKPVGRDGIVTVEGLYHLSRAL